jgi:hypothetical protein
MNGCFRFGTMTACPSELLCQSFRENSDLSLRAGVTESQPNPHNYNIPCGCGKAIDKSMVQYHIHVA